VVACSFVLILFSVKPLSGLDQNGDGMSDVWQKKYSVPSADADLDYSGIGLTNRQKSLLGLDPRDPNARFHLDIVHDSANNQLRLQLPTVYGKRYQIESSNDLQRWGSLNSTITGSGGMVEIAQPLPASPTFFRASYASDIDADGDGLTAWEEHELGTSDQNADTDGDGMPDWWEYKYGLNILVSDVTADPDGDGRSNLQEYQAGTDPTDYYNGNLPALMIYAGGDQRGNPGTILPVPISIVVNGNGRRNAPVTFTVTHGLALLAPDNSGNYAGVTSLTVRSTTRYPDALGFYVAQVYVYLPATAGNISIIEAMVATGGAISSVKTTAVAIDSSLIPPTNLLVTATSPTTAELSWTMASENTATMVQATLDEGRTWINLGAAGPGVNLVTVSGLTPDYPMSFRVFSSNDYTGITNSFTIPHDPTSVPQPSNGAGGDATASATVRPLSQPVIEGEEKSFNLGAWGFSGFQNQDTYLTKTAVLTCDPENSVTYIDRIDPITGRQLPRETQTTGSAGCFGFYLGEPNTGERTISNTEKLTESLPGDVDDFGRPVHKTLRLTLSDQNDEARLRQNAADKLPPFQGIFSESIESAYIYVDDSGYGITALQYRWRVNTDPNLVVTWDVQFRPVDSSVQHNVQQWVTNNNTLSPTYLVDPRTLNGGANGYYDVFLLMANLAVDGDRDGEMSFNDPAVRDADKTTSDRPYRFWLNDDDDTEINDGTDGNPIGPAETEQVPPFHPDYSLHRIVSKRNLEDFARLWMDIGGAQDALSWGIQIGLKWKNITGAPAINIYPSADGDGKNDYLSDETAAQAQISDPIFNDAIRDKNNKQTVDPNSTFIFKSDYWTDFNPKKCFLFEGVGEGKGELTVVFLDANGNEIAEGGSVWLDLKNIKKMYERAKAQPENILAPYDANPPFTGPVNYVSDPNGHEFQKPWDESDQCVVFVHGWNMNYDDYVSFSETMFKRLWQQGYTGHLAALRWDTRKSDGEFDTGEYNRSENRAFVYGTALKSLVTNLSANYTVSIVGHSMGNVVCGEGLRQGMLVRNYLMMEAAIPIGCYDANAPQLATLITQDQSYHTPAYHVDPANNQLTLGYGGYFSAVSGTLTNFCNPDDWALATGTTLGQNTNWETNQENYKPDGAVALVRHADSWSYHYDPTYPLDERAWLISSSYRNVTDSWEMKAFVARSRTKAVGALDYAGGPIGATINLRDNYGFGRERSDHSGQFTRNIQKLSALYKKMRDKLQE
jgi:pimeloyl-ACP methyl ester carboxylesterase